MSPDSATGSQARLDSVLQALAAAPVDADVPHLIVSQAVAATDSQGGVVCGMDQDRLVPLAAQGYPVGHPPVPGPQPVGDLWAPLTVVATTGEPVWLVSQADPVTRFPGVAPSARQEQACAALPLRTGGVLSGVLGIRFDHGHDFPDEERDFLLALADLCAAHLHQWRLIGSSVRAPTSASALGRLVRALSQAGTAEQMAQVIAEEGATAATATFANIALLDEGDVPATATLIHSSTLAADVASRYTTIPIDASTPLGLALGTGEEVWLRSLTDIGAHHPALLADTVAAGLAASASLPLIGGDQRLIGAMGLAWAGPQGFTDTQREEIRVVVRLAADALWRAQQRDRLEGLTAALDHNARRLRALQSVTAALATAVTTEEIAQVLVNDGITLLAEHGVAAMIDPDGATLRTWTSSGLPGEVTTHYRLVALDAVPPIAAAVRTDSPVVAQTQGEAITAFPAAAQSYLADGTRTTLAVPARAGGRTVGALALGFTRDGAIDEEVIEFATTLADLMGQALQRAAVYETSLRVAEALHRQTERARLLQRITQRLASSLTPAEVASVVLTEATRLLEASIITVFECQAGWARLISPESFPGAMSQDSRQSLDARTPVCEAIRTRRPVAALTGADRQGRFADDFVAATADLGPTIGLPLLIDDRPIGALGAAYPIGRVLTDDDVALAQTVADQCAQALERARLLRGEADARRRLEAVQAVTADLARAATTEAIAAVFLHGGIGRLADHGSFSVPTPDRRALLTWTVTRPGAPDDERPQLVPVEAHSMVAEAFLTGEPVVAQTSAEIRARFPRTAAVAGATGTASSLAIPIRLGDVTEGVLGFGYAREAAAGPADVAVAQSLADLTGQALQRARLFEQEQSAAHQLQQALLPVIDADLPGVVVEALYRPAERRNDVGGDWYDVFILPGGRVGFVVGDVAGHDLQAAATMGRLQPALRYCATISSCPASAVELLDQICRHIPGATLTTVFYGDYHPATGRLRYTNAGHPPPLLHTPTRSGISGPEDAGTADYLEDSHGLPLGVDDTLVRPQSSVTLAADAYLILYSDGLIERRHESLSDGLARLHTVVTGHPPDDPLWCRTMIERLEHTQPTQDDTVLLRLQLTTSAPDVDLPDVHA